MSCNYTNNEYCSSTKHPLDDCMPNNTYSHDCCSQTHPCPPPKPLFDCQQILEAYKHQINDSMKMYENANLMLSTEIIQSLCYTIKSLEDALCLRKTAHETIISSNQSLAMTGCINDVNINNSCCRSLLADTNKNNSLEDKNLLEALNSLKEACYKIKAALQLDDANEKLMDKYTSCIYSNSPEKYCSSIWCS